MASIKKTGPNKYQIRISKGTGKSRYSRSYTVRGRLKDAREFANEKERLLDLGIADSDISFNEYFEKWLKSISKSVSPRTHYGYESYIKRYALASLAPYKLSEIKTHHIQSIYDSMPLSSGTIHTLKAALNVCFNNAVRKEYLYKNPCKNCDLPVKETKAKKILPEEDIPAFIKACQESENGLIFEFALETGMRPEEYLGLKWSNLDLKRNTVSVTQVVSFYQKGGGFYFTKPKTAKSRRMIPLSQTLCDRLKAHRIRQTHQIKKTRERLNYAGYHLVFANQIGTPYSITNLTRRFFRPILKMAGIEKVTLYSLRHTCATMLLITGEHPKVVADRLGHSSVQLTLDTYSHVSPHMQERATEKLDNILRMPKSGKF